jgi:hypothetical protein
MPLLRLLAFLLLRPLTRTMMMARLLCPFVQPVMMRPPCSLRSLIQLLILRRLLGSAPVVFLLPVLFNQSRREVIVLPASWVSGG